MFKSYCVIEKSDNNNDDKVGDYDKINVEKKRIL